MRRDKYYPLLYKRAQRSRCAFIKVNASSGTRSMSESVREHVGSLLLNIYFFRNLLSLILIYSLASEPNKQRRCILAFSEKSTVLLRSYPNLLSMQIVGFDAWQVQMVPIPKYCDIFRIVEV